MSLIRQEYLFKHTDEPLHAYLHRAYIYIYVKVKADRLLLANTSNLLLAQIDYTSETLPFNQQIKSFIDVFKPHFMCHKLIKL